MNLGISILFKKPEVHQAELFSFMNPLGTLEHHKKDLYKNYPESHLSCLSPLILSLRSV